MKKKPNYWSELTYTQKVNYSFLVLVGVPIVFTIIPGFFGYVNIFTAYFPWFYLIWMLGGAIVRGILLVKTKRDKGAEHSSFVSGFVISAARWFIFGAVGVTLLVGYGLSLYGGGLSSVKLENCKASRQYTSWSGGIVVGNDFYNSIVPGYMKSADFDDFKDCRAVWDD